MKYRFVILLPLVLCVLSAANGQKNKPLLFSQAIKLLNVQGGFNHMSVDSGHMRLFATATANKTLEIIDLKDGKPLRSLEEERPAAARYAPEFNQLYLSSGQSVLIYDGDTFNLAASIRLDSGVDELQYDARAKQLYVGCMTPGKTGIAVISIPDGKLLGKIALPDKPQGIAVEHKGSRIYASMPTLRRIAVVDRDQRALVDSWPLKDVEGNAPLALDEARHRLFVGVRRPALLLVLDTATGKTVAKVDIDGDTDDLFYDAAHGRVYVSCGEGFVEVIEQRDHDRYRLLTRISTDEGSRTSIFSPELASLYLGVPRRGNQPAELRIFKVGN